MSTEKPFYVYVHRYASGPKQGQVFYVGKGTERRAWLNVGRNLHWKNIHNKYGHTVEIVLQFKKEHCAFSFERALIRHYGRENLCNLTDGGEGTTGRKVSENQKLKLSMDRSGKGNPMYGRSGDLNPMFGKSHTKASMEKMSGKNNWCFGLTGSSHPVWGKKHSVETKEKIRKRKIGKKLSEDHKKKISISLTGKNLKPVFTSCGLRFDSIKQACVWLRENVNKKASQGSISQCCSGKLKTAYGYTWSYAK